MDGEQMRKDKKSYSKQGQYITGIDGLRANAVLMVLAYHLQFPFAKFPDWRKRSACATLLLAILSMGAMRVLFDPSHDPSRVYYGTDTRVFSLLFGAFLAFAAGDGVIFALGANGLLYHSLDTLRDMLGPDRPLFLVTIRVPYVSWEEPNNEEIYAFTKARENTYLVDWYKISEGHGEYFAGDGIHLTYEGCQAYVNGIKEAAADVYRNQ